MESDSSEHKCRTKHDLKSQLLISFVCLVVFISSLIINLIQLINYLTIRSFSIDSYRAINFYLQYAIYSQIVAISEWWAGSTITFFYGDEDSQRWFGKEHILAVTNHRYELDAPFLWMTSEKINCLGSSKAFGKKQLKFVPMIGWTFFFGEYIFLERNWEKDSKTIEPALDRLMAHKHHIMIMLAAEGTRFTQHKYIASMQFAKDKGLDVHYKHHLLPRIKGFAHCVKHLKANHPECSIYNVQLAFNEKSVEPTVSNLIRGLPMNGHIYVKRIAVTSVPTETDEQIANFLYDLYSEKDRLMEYHKQNGHFPGIVDPKQSSLMPIVLLLTNIVAVGIPLAYSLFKVFTSGNYYAISLTLMAILIVYLALHYAIGSAKIATASTYGKSEAQNTGKNCKPFNGLKNTKEEN